MFVVLVVDAAGEAREIPAEPRDTVDRGALEASPHPPLEQISVRAAATQLPQEATMQKARRGAALPAQSRKRLARKEPDRIIDGTDPLMDMGHQGRIHHVGVHEEKLRVRPSKPKQSVERIRLDEA